MKERDLLVNTIKKEKEVRKEIKKHSKNSVISQPLLFVGPKYNQELVKLAQKGSAINMSFIDFSKIGAREKTSGQWVEKELKQIINRSQLEFSLICFLNINEISGTALEKALLPFFDHHQNFQHRNLDLSPFILLVTSSASQLEKLSPPLISRLKCVNQEEVKLPKTFLDKHFGLILVGLFLIILVGLFLTLRPSQRDKFNHSNKEFI